MPEHKVTMSEPTHDIRYSDIDFWVSADGKQMGHLHISQGGIDWYEGKSWIKKRSVTWEQFIALIKPVPKVAGKKPKLRR